MQSLDCSIGFVTDSSLLLIHATSLFEKGRLLKKAGGFRGISTSDIAGLAKLIDRLFSSAKEITITPYVLAELCNLAKSRLGLREDRLEGFLTLYTEMLLKMKEWQCTKEELIAFKESSKMCFTDSSVALASERKGVPLFTIDKRLVQWCKSRGIEAKDVYGEFYFSNLQNKIF